MAKKSGKYAAVLPRLKPHPGEQNPKRRDAIALLKTEIMLSTPDALTDARLYEGINATKAAMSKVIEDAKRLMNGSNYASSFASAYTKMRDLRDLIAEWDDSASLLVQAYQELMLDQMEVESVTRVDVDGRPVSTWDEPHAEVTDKEAHRLWCLANGFEKSMALPWATTNAETKARLIQGLPEPDGVTCFAKAKVRLGSE